MGIIVIIIYFGNILKNVTFSGDSMLWISEVETGLQALGATANPSLPMCRERIVANISIVVRQIHQQCHLYFINHTWYNLCKKIFCHSFCCKKSVLGSWCASTHKLMQEVARPSGCWQLSKDKHGRFFILFTVAYRQYKNETLSQSILTDGNRTLLPVTWKNVK